MALINAETLEIPPIVWRKPERELARHGTAARARYHLRYEGKGYVCANGCREAEARRLQDYRKSVRKLGHKLGGRWPR
jgi:hypothetical protein